MAQQIYDPPDLEGAGGRSYLSSLDAELVLRSLNGDTEAFAALFDRHAQRVTALAYNLLGDRADAEDITQETFLQALSALPTLRRPEAFGSWILRIATNTSLTGLRRRGHLPQARLSEAIGETFPDSGRWGSPEAMGLASEEQRSVHVTLTRLVPSQRAALAMREIGGLSYAEMARALGTTQGGVEALLFRARARFRDEYNKVALGAVAQPKMTTCQQARLALVALADDELAEPQRVKVVAHVRGCHTCAATLQAQRDTQRLLLALPIVVPSTLKVAVLVKVAPIMATYGAAGAAGASVGGAVTGGAITAGAALPPAAGASVSGAVGVTSLAAGGTAASTALAGAASSGAAGAVASATAAGAAAGGAVTAGVATGTGLAVSAGVAASAGAVSSIAATVTATAGAVSVGAASSVSAILPIIATGVGTTGAAKVAAVIVAGALLTGAFLGQPAPAAAPRHMAPQRASSGAPVLREQPQLPPQLAQPMPGPLALPRTSHTAHPDRHGHGSGPTASAAVKAGPGDVTPGTSVTAGPADPATLAGPPRTSTGGARPRLQTLATQGGSPPVPVSLSRSAVTARSTTPQRERIIGRRPPGTARTGTAQHPVAARSPERWPMSRGTSAGSENSQQPVAGGRPGSRAGRSPSAATAVVAQLQPEWPSPSPTSAAVEATSSGGEGAGQASGWVETGVAPTTGPVLPAVVTPAGGATPAAGDSGQPPAVLAAALATSLVPPTAVPIPPDGVASGTTLVAMTTPTAVAVLSATAATATATATVPLSPSVGADTLVTATTLITPSATISVTAVVTPDQMPVTLTVPISATAVPASDQRVTAAAGVPSPSSTPQGDEPTATATPATGDDAAPTATATTGDDVPVVAMPTAQDTAAAEATTSGDGSVDQTTDPTGMGQTPPDASVGQTAQPSPPAPTSTVVEDTPTDAPSSATSTAVPLTTLPTATATPLEPTPGSTATAVASPDSATPTPTTMAGMDGAQQQQQGLNGPDDPGSSASATPTPSATGGDSGDTNMGGPAIDDGAQQPSDVSPTATAVAPDQATAVATAADALPTDTPATDAVNTTNSGDATTPTDSAGAVATVVPATQTPDPQPPAPDDATPQGNLSPDDNSGTGVQTSPTATVQALVTADASTDGSGASPDASATAADPMALVTPTETPLSDESVGPDASATAAAAQTTATSDAPTAPATSTSDGDSVQSRGGVSSS